MPYSRNVEIYGEGEPAEYGLQDHRRCGPCHQAARRRPTAGHHLPPAGRDFWTRIRQGANHFSAEAVSDSTILIVKRSAVLALAARDGEVARQLWPLTANELEQLQHHMLVLGCMNAEEHVANSGGDDIVLPMSRQDIADYLGLTIEMVSRTISQLEHDAAIGLATSRRIVLRNRAMLGRLDG